ncbi:MAG: hypothetical protein WAT78_11830 [Rhizobiaceae bacterium]
MSSAIIGHFASCPHPSLHDISVHVVNRARIGEFPAAKSASLDDAITALRLEILFHAEQPDDSRDLTALMRLVDLHAELTALKAAS